MEMYKPDFQKAEQFWTVLQDVWIKLFGSKFITAAAITVSCKSISVDKLKSI